MLLLFFLFIWGEHSGKREGTVGVFAKGRLGCVVSEVGQEHLGVHWASSLLAFTSDQKSGDGCAGGNGHGLASWVPAGL